MNKHKLNITTHRDPPTTAQVRMDGKGVEGGP